MVSVAEGKATAKVRAPALPRLHVPARDSSQECNEAALVRTPRALLPANMQTDEARSSGGKEAARWEVPGRPMFTSLLSCNEYNIHAVVL